MRVMRVRFQLPQKTMVNPPAVATKLIASHAISIRARGLFLPQSVGEPGVLCIPGVSYADSFGRVLKSINPLGKVTSNSYDGQARLIRSAAPSAPRKTSPPWRADPA